MKALIFVEARPHNSYTLVDSEGNKFDLSFEFYDMDEKPKKGDKILIDEELLNPISEKFCRPYAMKPTKKLSVSRINKGIYKNYFILSVNQKIYPMERLFG